MNKSDFISAFERAAKHCRDFAQQFVVESLPISILFQFSASRNWATPSGHVKFLGGRLLKQDQLINVDEKAACRYLWVNGKVPCWINMKVVSADEKYTKVEITVSKKLTSEDTEFYHKDEGNPPFHVLSPSLPPGWLSIQESGKFSLFWENGDVTP